MQLEQGRTGPCDNILAIKQNRTRQYRKTTRSDNAKRTRLDNRIEPYKRALPLGIQSSSP